MLTYADISGGRDKEVLCGPDAERGDVREASYTPLTCLLHASYTHPARLLHASFTPLTCRLHTSHTPLTRHLHASYKPLTRLLHVRIGDVRGGFAAGMREVPRHARHTAGDTLRL